MRILLYFAIGLCGTAVDANAQVLHDLKPDQVRAALADDKAIGCYPISLVPVACFTTPYSRVVAVAASARRRYNTATEADVTSEVVAAGELHIHAFATAIDGRGMANVDAIVILPADSKDRSRAIHPTKTSDTTAQYKNLMGASFEGKSVTAVFSLAALGETNDVHIIFDKQLGRPAYCDDCAFELNLKNVK